MKKYLLILTTLLLVCETALGGRAFNPDAAATPTTTPAATATPPVATGAGFQESAKEASGKQKMGSLLGMAATVLCGYKAVGACSSQNYAMCAFWIGGALLSAKVTADMNKSKNISDQSIGDISITNPDGTVTHTKLPETVDQLLNDDPKGKEFRSILDNLKKKGIVVNTRTNTIKMPNGKSFKPSDFQSVEAMKNAGMTDQMIADATKAFKEVQEQAADGVAKAGTSSGDMSVTGSGGGGGEPSAETDESQGHETKNGLGINKDARQVAGTSKMYNGESIGVSVDSLFDMMKRRYELKQDQGTFIEKAK